MVDLAETLPQLHPRSTTPSRRSASPNLQSSPGSAKGRRIVPSVPSQSSLSPPGAYETVFRVESSPPQDSPPPAPSSAKSAMSQRAPSSFSPSFELSPILPLFLSITRCRDPITRRRALALLLNCRRREGVWDSLSAGIVAKDWFMQEENITNREVPADNWVPLTPGIQSCEDIPEENRIADVNVKVNHIEESVTLTYHKSDGGEIVVHKNPYEVGLFIGSSKARSS